MTRYQALRAAGFAAMLAGIGMKVLSFNPTDLSDFNHAIATFQVIEAGWIMVIGGYVWQLWSERNGNGS